MYFTQLKKSLLTVNYTRRDWRETSRRAGRPRAHIFSTHKRARDTARPGKQDAKTAKESYFSDKNVVE